MYWFRLTIRRTWVTFARGWYIPKKRFLFWLTYDPFKVIMRKRLSIPKMSGTHLPELRKVKLVHKVAHCWRFDLLLNDYGTEDRGSEVSLMSHEISLSDKMFRTEKYSDIIGYKVIACSTKGHLPLVANWPLNVVSCCKYYLVLLRCS